MPGDPYTPFLDLIEALKIEPKILELEILARELSDLAGRKKPWSWRALRALGTGHNKPGVRLQTAIMARLAMIDDVPALIAASETYQVIGPPGANLHGVYTHGEILTCDKPDCIIRFVRDHPRAKYCPQCSPRSLGQKSPRKRSKR